MSWCINFANHTYKANEQNSDDLTTQSFSVAFVFVYFNRPTVSEIFDSPSSILTFCNNTFWLNHIRIRWSLVRTMIQHKIASCWMICFLVIDLYSGFFLDTFWIVSMNLNRSQQRRFRVFVSDKWIFFWELVRICFVLSFILPNILNKKPTKLFGYKRLSVHVFVD